MRQFEPARIDYHRLVTGLLRDACARYRPELTLQEFRQRAWIAVELGYATGEMLVGESRMPRGRLPSGVTRVINQAIVG